VFRVVCIEGGIVVAFKPVLWSPVGAPAGVPGPRRNADDCDAGWFAPVATRRRPIFGALWAPSRWLAVSPGGTTPRNPPMGCRVRSAPSFGPGAGRVPCGPEGRSGARNLLCTGRGPARVPEPAMYRARSRPGPGTCYVQGAVPPGSRNLLCTGRGPAPVPLASPSRCFRRPTRHLWCPDMTVTGHRSANSGRQGPCERAACSRSHVSRRTRRGRRPEVAWVPHVPSAPGHPPGIGAQRTCRAIRKGRAWGGGGRKRCPRHTTASPPRANGENPAPARASPPEPRGRPPTPAPAPNAQRRRRKDSQASPEGDTQHCQPFKGIDCFLLGPGMLSLWSLYPVFKVRQAFPNRHLDNRPAAIRAY
jgi:hypothetical protein